ncbi:MAG: helix-turn-helix domain-containing protein [Clostridiales bacterium]|nr:helix-turn-helix domain-containing protein [Clostridiales bacterium]
MKESGEYGAYLRALEEIREEHRIGRENYLNRQLSQEFYLLHEILGTYRKERGLRVSEIDRDVCSEKTYRALERGKRNANKGTYELLAAYMGIPFYIISSEIVTEKYSDLQLVAEIRRAGQQENASERLRLLSELEESLGENVNIPQNRQYIDSVRDLEMMFAGSISPLEYKERVEEALRLTIPKWKPGYGIHFYTRREIILVYYEAIAFRRLKQYQTAIGLLENMWAQLEASDIDKIYRMHEVLLILSLWKNLLTEIGQYDEAMRMAVDGIKLCFLSGRGDMLDTFVLERGWSLEHKYPEMTIREKREKCFPDVWNALCITRLFHQPETEKRLEQYCKEHFYANMD